VSDARVAVAASGPLDVDVAADGDRLVVTLRNAGRDTVTVDRVEILTEPRPARVLEHGYQSWSPVRRTTASDVRPARSELPGWVRGMYAGDPDRAGRVVAGDQFLVTDAGVVGFLDARSHLGTVEARTDGTVVAVALLDGVPIEPGGQRALDPLWVRTGRAGPLYSELATAWGAEAGARVTGRTAFGWCSWYQYFADVLPEHVRGNLAAAVEHNVDLVQIDDGYQAAIGDWLRTRATWPDGTAALARDIAAAGAHAGIWTAPFLVGENSELLARHPEWVAHHHTGRGARAAYNDPWGGWALALDTTRADVLDHLRQTYAALTEQGFDYHKIDFCYAAALPATRADRTKTRAEALRMGLAAVRDGIGDDAYLLGCGCPFGPAVGVVDAMRVSADVAPDWAPRYNFPGFEEAAPAARNAVMGSVLRAPLHRRVFVGDPDCLVLRPVDTDLDANQRAVLTDAVAGTGAFVVLSDDLATYTDAEWAVVERLRATQPSLDTTLDLDDPFADPVVVRAANGSTLTVDWREPRASLDVRQV
jgi:alpha-galactosidase